MSVFMPLLKGGIGPSQIRKENSIWISSGIYYSENRSFMPLSTDASVQRGGFDLLFS